MSSIDEKRVYDHTTDPETAYVASDTGVASISIVGEQVGEISLGYRDPARDVVTIGERIVVATPENVVALVDGEVTELGFGPATAVGVDPHGAILAGSEGTLARYEDGDAEAEDGWRTIGSVGEIRAIDGDLVASSEGVYRLVSDELRYSGLDDVADVSSAGTLRAATPGGLYTLGNGWLKTVDGAFSVVTGASRPTSTGTGERAHAVGTAGLYEYAAEGWQRCVLPVEERVVDVAYGTGVYAVTDEGTLLTDAGEGWRGHPLGVRGVRAIDVAGDVDP